jgi:hypothetical protein
MSHPTFYTVTDIQWPEIKKLNIIWNLHVRLSADFCVQNALKFTHAHVISKIFLGFIPPDSRYKGKWKGMGKEKGDGGWNGVRRGGNGWRRGTRTPNLNSVVAPLIFHVRQTSRNLATNIEDSLKQNMISKLE